MLLRLPGSKGSLWIGHENKYLLEQSTGVTGIPKTKFRPYAWIGKHPNAGETSCTSQKVMPCGRDAVPRKSKFAICFSPVSLLILLSASQTFPPHGSLINCSICILCFHSSPFKLSSHSYLLSLLPYMFCLFVCSSFISTCGFSTVLATFLSSSGCLHDPILIFLFFLFY